MYSSGLNMVTDVHEKEGALSDPWCQGEVDEQTRQFTVLPFCISVDSSY